MQSGAEWRSTVVRDDLQCVGCCSQKWRTHKGEQKAGDLF